MNLNQQYLQNILIQHIKMKNYLILIKVFNLLHKDMYQQKKL